MSKSQKEEKIKLENDRFTWFYWHRLFLIFLLAGFLLGCQEVTGADVFSEGPTTTISVIDEVGTRIAGQTGETVEIAGSESPNDPAATLAPKAVVLDISYLGGYDSLDPQITADDNAIDVIENIFVGLTRYNAEFDAIEPQLAIGWAVSDDGLTWIFNLRDDIYWLDVQGGGATFVGLGELEVNRVRPVTASDMVFAIRRICDPRVPTPDVFIYFVIEGCEHVNNLLEVNDQALEGIGAVAIDDSTLQIKLTEPASHFLTLTTLWQMRPIPQEMFEELEEEEGLEEDMTMTQDILTSGPYFLDSRSNTDEQTILNRNPYWPIPFRGNVDVVNILHSENNMDAYALWEQRMLDISPIPLEYEEEIIDMHSLKSELVPEQSVFFLNFNFDSPAVNAPEVRRALSWAIDRERVVEEVYGNHGLAVRHFAPPGVFGAPPFEEVGVGYSPDRARLEMDNSSFGHCTFLPDITYLVNSTDLALQQAELIREMWVDELGCAEEQFLIEQVDLGQLLQRTSPDAGQARPDIWDLGWMSYYPDANNWVGDVLHCLNGENRQRRPCSQVDDLILEAGRTGSTDEGDFSNR